MAEEFITYYPGIYSDEDRAVLDDFLSVNDGIAARGEITRERIENGEVRRGVTPGFRGGRAVSPVETRKDAKKFDLHNPLYQDDDYARSLGYQGALAFPLAYTPDAAFYIGCPPALFQFLLASGLNHSFTIYRDVYPGDTMYCIIDRRQVRDITPEAGSIYRTLDLYAEGRILNQRGELVASGHSNIKESLKNYADPSVDLTPLYNWDNPDYHTPGIWESGDWWSRPAHIYTDADWADITARWKAERRRGAEPLYWEDVQVGTQIPETIEGPFTAAAMNRGMPKREKPKPGEGPGQDPDHMGDDGPGGPEGEMGPPPEMPEDPNTDWRTTKDKMLDPETFRTMRRCAANGIYYTEEDFPELEEDGSLPRRKTIGNYMPVAFIYKTLFDWMGDRGKLRAISWGIMFENPGVSTELVPVSSRTPDFLQAVPFLRGQKITAHAMMGDLCINNAYITDKYYQPGTGWCVDLTWWCKTYEGDIFEAGTATVSLPSRTGRS